MVINVDKKFSKQQAATAPRLIKTMALVEVAVASAFIISFPLEQSSEKLNPNCSKEESNITANTIHSTIKFLNDTLVTRKTHIYVIYKPLLIAYFAFSLCHSHTPPNIIFQL